MAGATRAARSTRRDSHGRWLWRLVRLWTHRVGIRTENNRKSLLRLPLASFFFAAAASEKHPSFRLKISPPRREIAAAASHRELRQKYPRHLFFGESLSDDRAT